MQTFSVNRTDTYCTIDHNSNYNLKEKIFLRNRKLVKYSYFQVKF